MENANNSTISRVIRGALIIFLVNNHRTKGHCLQPCKKWPKKEELCFGQAAERNWESVRV